MMRLIGPVIANIVGLWVAVKFIPGVQIQVVSGSDFLGFPLTAAWQVFVLLGLVLTLLNYFLKPFLNLITLPLRILSLGIISLFISMLMIWILDLVFKELIISSLVALFWTTLIIWGANLIIDNITKRKK